MPGVRRGQGSTSFIDRELQTGKRRAAISDVPQPGGLGGVSPTGLGSTPQRPVNAPQGGEREALLNTPARRAGSAPMSTGAPTAEPRLLSIPRIDEEFPVADLVGSTLTGQNVATTTFGERFYRRYGRYPTDVDLNIISLRKRYEADKGRPPTRDELLGYLRQGVLNRSDEMLG